MERRRLLITWTAEMIRARCPSCEAVEQYDISLDLPKFEGQEERREFLLEINREVVERISRRCHCPEWVGKELS